MINLDFDKAFKLIEERQKENEQRSNRSSNSTPQNYGSYQTIFLDSILGTYQMKVILDKNSELWSEVNAHSIPDPSSGRNVSTACSGPDCQICKAANKLRDLDYGAAWRYSRRSYDKFLMKTGPEVNVINSDQLQPNTVYLCYVRKKYSKNLIDSIKNNTKYFHDDVTKMLDPLSNSGGFLVSSKQVNRSNEFNFQFIPALQIESVNVEDAFGSEDKFDLKTLGFWNTVDESKYNTALSLANAKVLEVSSLSNQNTTESKVETPVETSQPEVSTSTESNDVVESEVMPECFGKFDDSSEKCLKECPHKKDCVKQMIMNDN